MTLDELQKHLDTLSPLKRTLWEMRLVEAGLKIPSNVAILRRTDRQLAPLSFAQERLWFLNQLEPESPAYNEASVLRFIGPLNVHLVERSLNQIIARHESFRTTIVVMDNKALQRIAAHRNIDLVRFDLTGGGDHNRESQVQQLIDKAIQRPFDLSEDLGLQVALLKLQETEHILILVKHHIFTDRWSSAIFWQEFAALYESFSAGQSADLPELPVQYADFAAWQRDWLQGDNLDKQISYWREQLRDLPPLQLPADRPRPEYLNPRGSIQTFSLSDKVSTNLKTLSREEGNTLFMSLLAAFQTLLYRYSAQEDIAVGSLIAGRNRQEIESLIGFFANTLVLRTDFSNNPTFRELLGRVRTVCLNAYSHQDVPFEKIVEELHPDRSLNQNPLFQITFQLDSSPRKPLILPGVRVERIDSEHPMSKFDLSLSISDREESLSGRLIYNTDLFDAATIERMLGHFQTLLEGIVANPDQRIGELPLLTEAEKHQLLVEWNDTKTDYPNDKCIHKLFEDQVERTPEAVAVVFEDEQLSYRELNNRANQLARHLHKFGVGPDIVVGLYLERSIEMIIGLLGILKAGGAYLPLDPSYPRERIAYMLDDAQAKVLLTHARWHNLISSYAGVSIALDLDWTVIAREKVEPPASGVNPENLAYVIYTSGSTGTPKGVAIQHRALCNHMHWLLAEFPISDADRVFLKTPHSFDASVWEIFAPLLRGARLIIGKPDGHKEPSYLVKTIISNQITVLQVVPSLLNLLLQEASLNQCISLKYVFCGGEKLPTHLHKQFSDLMHLELINLYGPTEACIDVTYWRNRTATPSDDAPIGKPIANTQVYILDAYLNPVPIGVPGELHIGGVGLARGYLNQPELTQEKFIADPFSEEPGARLYKTGDLARYLSDGNIEFLGRIDSQVKIRGYRIELGEIESVLAQHPAVQREAVLAREDTPGDKRLVAYVVSPTGSAPSAHDLRSFLQHKLPDYMVPSAFVFLDSLPLTPNGKLDRQALPAPDQSRPELEDASATPRTPVEEILANIWSEILKLDQVGIHDNFFHLGGHSLLATQVVSRINHSFQTNLPLRRLFESPTIAGLADSVQASIGSENDSRPLQPIVPVPRTDDTPLSFAQERLWFLDRLDPDSPTYNMPAAFRIAGDLNINALEQSLNEVARRHESLRTVFATVNGNPVQKISPSLIVSLTPIDLSDLPENERKSALQCLLKEEDRQPFDLSQGPLLRACLWRLAPQEHVLALIMHHVVSDGWSMGVLFREISALYQAYCSGKPSPLIDLPIQYADYSVWQRDWLQGENLDKQVSYWRKQLDGFSTLQLPTNHPRPAVQTYRGASQSVELSAQLSHALKGLSQHEGVTLFMTLLVAFQVLLSRYCGQSDITVGTPIAGRTRRETEGLIGFFVNTLVLRADLSNNPTFKELLCQIRETTLEAYTHQDLPFEKLVEELQPERNPSISPLFQVMFILQNNADRSLEFEHLAVSPIRTASQVAKFDLSLTMSERRGSLRASFNYNTDLFDAATVGRMLGHFQTLLEGIVAAPDQRIGELPLLTTAETHQLLVEWNDTKTEYPKDKCIHQLFEDQVERTPDAVALIFEDQQLTYRELNNRANQLARYLIREGAQSGTAVGIYLDRSLELPVALLAVLKAGGVYVPVDPSYPIERVKFILQDVQAAVVVTTQCLASQLPLSGAPILTLDTELEKFDQADISNPSVVVGSQSAAYILYTSGSTGTPKGVGMSHRALNNLISWQVNGFGLGLPARTLQFAPLGFDVSIQEMFSTWCAGGSLYLIPNHLRQDGSCLLKFIETHSIERIFLPFVALQHFAEIAVNEDRTPQSLREIVTAGEQLRLTEPLRQFLDRLDSCCLYNQYGPTETHVVTEYTLSPPFQQESNLPPIGRPIANTQIFLLDAHLNPAPIGVPGELHISGDGVALGYLNRPELNQEKFIANPFSNDPENRLYKSGDLARYRPDGNIEFLGRIDNQVKIRGYRIEPGEIEDVLTQHPAVQQAVVLAPEDTPGDKRLVAYAVSANGSAPSAHDLRSFLQNKLPDYMVPSAFVFLDSLPLTPNGKLDRKSLPAPDQTRPDIEDIFVAPRTAVEETLANIWCTVLKLDKVGIHDNFFHLGGHSLLATQVISRIRDALKLDLPVRTLFEAPTIQGFSQKLQEIEDEQDATEGAPIAPVGREQYRLRTWNSKERLTAGVASNQRSKLPAEQQAIRDKCFHRSGEFDPFPAADAAQSIQLRFEKIVDRYPDHIAVKAGDEKITYLALNKAANRLANGILALRGKGREVVGFSHAHGILPLISHLAILKAGKISVELDPAAPPSRNAHIMVDSTAQIILTDNCTIPVAGNWISTDQVLLNIDELDSSLNDQNPKVSSPSEDVAFIRYTSGSTGQAKGAVKTHRHVLHEVMVATNCFRLCKQDRISHLSRESMGKFVFSALLNGATLYPLDTKQGSLVKLAEWLREEGITTYQSFPTAFRCFTNSLNGEERFPSLRLIRLEGEMLYRRDVELFKRYFAPECLFVNVYSSAETGTVSLYFMDHTSEITGNAVPMGYPLEHKQVMLLDDRGNNVGMNRVGEIAVKSQFLSSGYWRKTDTTQQKFLRDPSEIDLQIYLTGDLGAVSEQGLLQHFGRKDLQVKIRGFRVDTGEVEATLTEHQGIKEAVVVAQEDRLGNNELVAHIVTQNGAALDTSALREFLYQRLPEYMIPVHFVKADDFPLTATGKVDRIKLAAVDIVRLESSSDYGAPRTLIEERIAAIWREILSLQRVGVHDNFFELGGHSLSATQVISRIRDTFDFDLPLKSLFESRTIAALAEQVETHSVRNSTSHQPPISRIVRDQYKTKRKT